MVVVDYYEDNMNTGT